MKLSIIIVSYNTKKLTLSCLESLDKYPYSGKFEVIIVDNNSTDGSQSAVAKYKPKNYKLLPVQNKENSGFSKGNNIGIRKAKGEYILLLNSDTEVLKDSLNGLMDFAIKHKEVGVVAPKLVNKDGSVQYSVFRLPSINRAIRQYIFAEGKILDKYVPEAKTPTEVEVVVGAAFLITPAARKKAGLLDERYFMYFEDIDYCRKVRKAGLKVYYLPSTKVVHIHGASGQASKEQMNRLISASKIYHGLVRHHIIQVLIKVGRKLHYEKT